MCLLYCVRVFVYYLKIILGFCIFNHITCSIGVIFTEALPLHMLYFLTQECLWSLCVVCSHFQQSILSYLGWLLTLGNITIAPCVSELSSP